MNNQEMIRDEIQFFIEMLKTPNIDRDTVTMINDTIRTLLYRYNHPTSFVVKVGEEK